MVDRERLILARAWAARWKRAAKQQRDWCHTAEKERDRSIADRFTTLDELWVAAAWAARWKRAAKTERSKARAQHALVKSYRAITDLRRADLAAARAEYETLRKAYDLLMDDARRDYERISASCARLRAALVQARVALELWALQESVPVICLKRAHVRAADDECSGCQHAQQWNRDTGLRNRTLAAIGAALAGADPAGGGGA